MILRTNLASGNIHCIRVINSHNSNLLEQKSFAVKNSRSAGCPKDLQIQCKIHQFTRYLKNKLPQKYVNRLFTCISSQTFFSNFGSFGIFFFIVWAKKINVIVVIIISLGSSGSGEIRFRSLLFKKLGIKWLFLLHRSLFYATKN